MKLLTNYHLAFSNNFALYSYQWLHLFRKKTENCQFNVNCKLKIVNLSEQGER